MAAVSARLRLVRRATRVCRANWSCLRSSDRLLHVAQRDLQLARVTRRGEESTQRMCAASRASAWGANAGSVFQNPEAARRRTDRGGRMQGLRVRSASVSEKHANFILVDENGRANDVYELLKRYGSVLEFSGVALRPSTDSRLRGLRVSRVAQCVQRRRRVTSPQRSASRRSPRCCDPRRDRHRVSAGWPMGAAPILLRGQHVSLSGVRHESSAQVLARRD